MRKPIRVIGINLIVCLLLSACGQQSVLMETTQVTQATEQTMMPQQTQTAPPELPEETGCPETVPAETQPQTAPVEPAEDAFVAVQEYLPDMVVELKYASQDNFTGRKIYGFDTCYLRYGTVKKLMAVQEDLRSRGLSLKIWDGFRPVSAQFALWEVCPDPTYVANPEKGFSSHSRGNTVDITLVKEQGEELEMPTGFDDFSALADRDYSDCTLEAAENAKLLQSLMEANGFTGYYGEWWHFSDTEDYEVEKVFDPGVVSERYADCNEFISLRTAPDTSAQVILRILAGERFTLLGYTGDFSMVEYRGQIGYVLTGYTASVTEE